MICAEALTLPLTIQTCGQPVTLHVCFRADQADDAGSLRWTRPDGVAVVASWDSRRGWPRVQRRYQRDHRACARHTGAA